MSTFTSRLGVAIALVGLLVFAGGCDRQEGRPGAEQENDMRRKKLEEKLQLPSGDGVEVVVEIGVDLAPLVDLDLAEAARTVGVGAGGDGRPGALPITPSEDGWLVICDFSRIAMPVEIPEGGLGTGRLVKQLADFLYDEVYSRPDASGLASSEMAGVPFRLLRLERIVIDEFDGTILPEFATLADDGDAPTAPRRQADSEHPTPDEKRALFGRAEQQLGIEFPQALKDFHVTGGETELGSLHAVEDLLDLPEIVHPNMPLRFIPLIDANGDLEYGLYFPRDGRPPLVGLNVATQFFVLITSDQERYWADPARFDIHDEEVFGERLAAEDRSAWVDLEVGGSADEVEEILKPIGLNVGDYERFGREIKEGAETGESPLWAIHGKALQHGELAEVFPDPVDLLTAGAWAKLAENLVASGDLGQAGAAAENAVAVTGLHPYYGFPAEFREALGHPSFWRKLRERSRPFYQLAARIAGERGDKIGAATTAAQLAVLDEWIRAED